MCVSTFRDPRIMGYMLLPAAFRSLSRLSSAPSAQASTLRSSSLNHIPLLLQRFLPRCLAWHLMVFFQEGFFSWQDDLFILPD